MAKQKFPQLEVLSFNELTKDLLALDAIQVSTDVDGYFLSNRESYYLLINTWLLLLQNITKFGWYSILRSIKSRGLLYTIKIAQQAADAIVTTEGEIPSEIIPVMTDACTQDTATVLQALRYPKRFSPDRADRLQQVGFAEFIDCDNKVKLLNRRGFNTQLLNWLKSILQKKLGKRPKEYPKPYITNGAARDASRPLAHKLIRLATYDPWFVSERGPIYSYTDPEYNYFGGRSTYGGERMPLFKKDTVTIAAVPKSYKAIRIIAEEDTFRQYKLTSIAQYLDAILEKNFVPRKGTLNAFAISEIDIHNQSTNQELARIGSISGALDTIDLSHASDMNSRLLFRSIFPDWLIKDLERYLPTHYEINGKERLMNAYCTAGNVTTFAIESLTFWAICELARQLHSLFNPGNYTVSVYGDDIIISHDLSVLVQELLQHFGFIVNESKSFTSNEHLYRESCGEEYLRGVNLSSKYFPRKVLQFDRSNQGVIKGDLTNLTLTSLVELEHRLYSCIPARLFLQEFVWSIEPRMTTSSPGSECSDLWDEIPKSKLLPPPSKGKVDESLFRESHLCPTTKIKPIVCHCKCCESNGVVLDKSILEHVYDQYRYYRFLEYGPSYEDELSKLLKISSPDIPFADVYNLHTISWKYLN